MQKSDTVPVTMKGLSECTEFGDLEGMYHVFTIEQDMEGNLGAVRERQVVLLSKKELSGRQKVTCLRKMPGAIREMCFVITNHQ